jgi:osmotically-inducible protein OsmY
MDMDIRSRSIDLEVVVTRALHQYSPFATRNVIVAAAPDGTVWLRGSIGRRVECDAIKSLVGGLPGVKLVFCNIATQS